MQESERKGKASRDVPFGYGSGYQPGRIESTEVCRMQNDACR
jgi:hypothetical protein